MSLLLVCMGSCVSMGLYVCAYVRVHSVCVR